MIWFNPLFTKIFPWTLSGKFYPAVDTIFHKYHKLINVNSVKVYYFCADNITFNIVHYKRISFLPICNCPNQSTLLSEFGLSKRVACRATLTPSDSLPIELNGFCRQQHQHFHLTYIHSFELVYWKHIYSYLSFFKFRSLWK